MQFVVPQFIEVEAKIIGPISARQFIIIVLTMGIMFIWFKIFGTIPFLLATLVTGAIGGALAFGKVNGQSMHYVLLNLLQTLKRPSLKLWRRIPYNELSPLTTVDHQEQIIPKQQASTSRLAAMSLMVDTGGAFAGSEVATTEKPVNTARPADAPLPVKGKQ